MKAIEIARTGGPEVLDLVDKPARAPGEGEVAVRQSAVGLNFIDVYHRTGLYPVKLPFTPGVEGAGRVEAVGPGVAGFKPGDRVAYGTANNGGYGEVNVVPAGRLVLLPDGVSEETAAAMMLKGLTAQYLIKSTYRVKAGDTILVHAAAGGVGLILCQWAKHLGATVIGTVGSDEKAALARANGCAHTILYRSEDVAARVREITGGKGVPVVYDSVGKATFEGSLNSLGPLGLFVSFGNASGPVPPIDPLILAAKGSLFFTRCSVFTYSAPPGALAAMARDLFEVVAGGKVRIAIGRRFALAEAPAAHRALEGRETTGASLLIP
ncbi:MAG: quinone oxidoreductase [Alphaproteobacteria bacterium]|nr:quinone oxidoreductase [Alphaproteobacteria bacterium]